jgi:hypothetical protein
VNNVLPGEVYTSAPVSDIIHLSPPSAHAFLALDARRVLDPMKVVVLVVAAFVLMTVLHGPTVLEGGGPAPWPDRTP